MKIIFLCLFFTLIGICLAEKKIVCYHGTWSVYRHSIGKFNVANINPYLCTHLIYAFFGVQENGEIRIIDPYLDLEENWGLGNIKKFNNLKKINPNLKTLAAVGGWNEGSYKFSQVANDPVKRERFVTSSVAMILIYGFDGLDLDWEYPGQRGGDPKIDKENYIQLLKELKEELDKYDLLFTAAVASVEYSAKQSYDIAEISKYFDFINVMSYDLHGSWDDTIGINAPLYVGSADITDKQKQLNIDSIFNYWLNQGAPAEKIILGLPFYGRTFTLSNSSENYVGAKSNGPGLPGRYTNEPGMIGYNELCEKFETEQWVHEWENQQKVPYAYKGNQWVGYDDRTSVGLKTQYAIDMNLGGVMVWSVETDDFRGVCGESYPLLKAINREFGRDIPEIPEEPTSTPHLPPSEGNTQPPSEVQCSPDGIFRDKNNCANFYICSSGIRYDFQCPGELLFDEDLKSCNYPNAVKC